MRVFWSEGDTFSATLIDETVSTLKALMNPNPPFISYQDFLWGSDSSRVLVSLSQHMQHTTSLYVRAEGMIGLLSRLPRFSQLEYLALDSCYSWFGEPTRRSVTDAWEVVQIKVDRGIIDALKACRIRSSHFRLTDETEWKKVDGMWEEYPEEDFQMQSGLTTFTTDCLW
ncbi:hypothetical protein FB45DRAFT_1084452 [Roridomyces roridus]|uniref:Uncharacterized protein n=1 Tax=Roridomyces roridus TaxID=1738132 RepID=A0AAD7BMZ0_9AGAR|nr:hypothetical protein FB45DRAFT_1084452 [Roridomyces roridus]